MEKVNLPTEKAFEPNEEAHQPLEETMTPRLAGQLTRKLITFADDTDTEKSPSQRSSNYKEVLSQPAPSLSHRQKLLWLQKRRTAGLWVQCDDCSQWRFLSDVLDRYELPQKWYCRMNPDTANADCSIPEVPICVREEEDLIHSEYSAGSVVWARLPGWPWWPAVVDDCPDTEQFYWLDGFSDIPTHYNVVFFDSKEATRAWIAPEHLKPYIAHKKAMKPFLKDKKNKTRLRVAVNQADDATKLPLAARLQKYSFLARYKGNFNTPKKANKNDLRKHQKYLKRRFDIDFEVDTSNESEDDEVPRKTSRNKNKNVIVLGTPKRARTKPNSISNEIDVTEAKTVAEKNAQAVKTNRAEQKGVEKMKPDSETEASTNIENDTAELENTDKGKPDSEVTTDALTVEVFKRPNSLAVQVGSTIDSALIQEPFDDDTSKTYIPENESQESTQSIQTNTVTSEVTEFQVRIASPSSDDFDF